MEDDASVPAMRRALDLGITFIDTADVYGDGHSEELVGKVVQGRRDQVVLATKGGLMGHHRDPSGTPVYDRPEKVHEGPRQQLSTVGHRLRRRLLRPHLVGSARGDRGVSRRAAQLKADGKERAVGMSTDDLDYIKHLNRDRGLDVVQLEYSILNRHAEQEILPYLAEHGTAVSFHLSTFERLPTSCWSDRRRFRLEAPRRCRLAAKR